MKRFFNIIPNDRLTFQWVKYNCGFWKRASLKDKIKILFSKTYMTFAVEVQNYDKKGKYINKAIGNYKVYYKKYKNLIYVINVSGF